MITNRQGLYTQQQHNELLDASKGWHVTIEHWLPDDNWAKYRPLARLALSISQSWFGSELYPFPFNLPWPENKYRGPGFAIYKDDRVNRYLHEHITISYNPDRQFYLFDYWDRLDVEPHWKKEGPYEEAFSAFVHFLAIKNWLSRPVYDVPRGSWEPVTLQQQGQLKPGNSQEN